MPADAGTTDEKVAIGVGVGGSTVYRTRRRFVLGNRAAALSEEPRPGGASRKLSGKEQALLVATACSGPHNGTANLFVFLNCTSALVKGQSHRRPDRCGLRGLMRDLTEFTFLSRAVSGFP